MKFHDFADGTALRNALSRRIVKTIALLARALPSGVRSEQTKAFWERARIGRSRLFRSSEMPSPARKRFRTLCWILAASVAIVFGLLWWGADLLILSEPAPKHVEAAIVLQGSIVAEKVRIAGAVGLLQRGFADRVLLSVPKESYWGQSVPPAARAFIEKNYGSDAAGRVDFCETGAEVNSTLQEAQALIPCIEEHHWHAIAVVTSDYHTRRAGTLWRRAVKERSPGVHIWIDGVADPEFQQPWWRYRQSAKIWFMESLKLVWSMLRA
jgi:hypothetical protein